MPAGGAAAGTPFSFVAGVNIGPLLARREAFLRVGGFDEAFSCAGQPGIHLDTELSLQMWRRGYQVGLWYSAVANGVGGRKTRTNPEQKRARLRNDNVNGKRCERLMRTTTPPPSPPPTRSSRRPPPTPTRGGRSARPRCASAGC